MRLQKHIERTVVFEEGEPVSFTPTRTLVDMGKVTVTMIPATTEHAFDVLSSQSQLSKIRGSSVFQRISFGVSSLLLRR